MAIDVTSFYNRRATNRWDRINVGDILERNTWGRPDKAAIVGWEGAYAYPQHERLSYASANGLQNQVANGLLAAGLERGDRVLLFCENSVEAYIAKGAIAKAGLVGMPLNPSIADDVIDSLLERFAPEFVIADAEFASRLRACLDRVGIALDVTIAIGGEATDGSVDFAEFTRTQSTVEPDVETHGDDIWEILFTSGTTSGPKGAMSSHINAQLAAQGFASSLSRGLRREHDLVLVTFLPVVYHVANYIYALPAWTAGGTLVIGRRYDGAELSRAITREKATAVWGGNPMMLGGLADAAETDPDADLASITYAGFGWACISPELYRRFQQLTGPEFQFMTHLGQTEAISCLRFYPEEREDKFFDKAPAVNIVGAPNPLLASRLVDADGNEVTEPGVPGEVVFRSPVMMAGYYGDEKATEEAFAGGWFHTGDSCLIDEDGDRVFIDRFKDIVKTGGENVSSARVESVILTHPSIARAAVVGIPHERWGEAVTAVIVLRERAEFDRDELIAFLRLRLAGYEIPKEIIVTDTLPETTGGKIRKFRLREQYADRYTKDGGS